MRLRALNGPRQLLGVIAGVTVWCGLALVAAWQLFREPDPRYRPFEVVPIDRWPLTIGRILIVAGLVVGTGAWYSAPVWTEGARVPTTFGRLFPAAVLGVLLLATVVPVLLVAFVAR